MRASLKAFSYNEDQNNYTGSSLTLDLGICPKVYIFSTGYHPYGNENEMKFLLARFDIRDHRSSALLCLSSPINRSAIPKVCAALFCRTDNLHPADFCSSPSRAHYRASSLFNCSIRLLASTFLLCNCHLVLTELSAIEFYYDVQCGLQNNPEQLSDMSWGKALLLIEFARLTLCGMVHLGICSIPGRPG